MHLILALRELNGNISVEDMRMIADINRIILNLKFMSNLLNRQRSEKHA